MQKAADIYSICAKEYNAIPVISEDENKPPIFRNNPIITVSKKGL